MDTVFFTGFPGFLGSELLPRVLQATEGNALCLVQPPFAQLAERRRQALVEQAPALEGRIQLVEGDVTVPGLGVSPSLQEGLTQVFHLAAIYDLSVGRDRAMTVNVHGTRHVLEWASRCRALQRFHYMSTCFVSGRYDGIFYEEDLDKGQRFNNFYEETKFFAEDEVQSRMREGLPGTIYRPSIVVGDSRFGRTQKYDGPYFVIQWLLRQPHWALLPMVGKPDLYRVNVVPLDFVVEAIAYLSAQPRSRGRVYQLADPFPPTVREMVQILAEATGKRVLPVPVNRRVAKSALRRVPGLYRWMRIPPNALDYFVHPTTYDTGQARADLAGSGLAVPPFATYAARLTRFMSEHPELGATPMA